MSNFFVPSTRIANPPTANPFSVSTFSAAQKAHAYAEVDAQTKRQTMQTSPLEPAFQPSHPAGIDEPLPESGQHSHRRAWAAGIAFFTTVFASMAAAATVASSDFPLMIVGL